MGDLWDEFAAETGMETWPEVLDALERRSAWREAHPAQAEMAQVFGWHEQQSYGLDGDFLRVVAAVEERLTHNPQAFPPHAAGFAASGCDAFRMPCTLSY